MITRMLNYKLGLAILLGIGVIYGMLGCSSTAQNNSAIPKPPQNFSQSTRVDNPPPMNKNTDQSLSASESQTTGESYVPYTRVEETRTSGGTVTQIKVNNRGVLPSYYIYPNQQQSENLNVNNQQKNIATPTWQINW